MHVAARSVAGLALVAVLAGCGSDDPEEPTVSDASEPTDLGTKPEVTVPDGPPPTELVATDLVVGDGDEATPGNRVQVHYVGLSHGTGQQFDASWDRGQEFSFALGGGQVIAGWDQGVTGMRVGGRRQLVIPPHLAYGDRGAGGVIAPGETLVFVVDLLGIG